MGTLEGEYHSPHTAPSTPDLHMGAADHPIPPPAAAAKPVALRIPQEEDEFEQELLQQQVGRSLQALPTFSAGMGQAAATAAGAARPAAPAAAAAVMPASQAASKPQEGSGGLGSSARTEASYDAQSQRQHEEQGTGEGIDEDDDDEFSEFMASLPGLGSLPQPLSALRQQALEEELAQLAAHDQQHQQAKRTPGASASVTPLSQRTPVNTPPMSPLRQRTPAASPPMSPYGHHTPATASPPMSPLRQRTPGTSPPMSPIGGRKTPPRSERSYLSNAEVLEFEPVESTPSPSSIDSEEAATQASQAAQARVLAATRAWSSFRSPADGGGGSGGYAAPSTSSAAAAAGGARAGAGAGSGAGGVLLLDQPRGAGAGSSAVAQRAVAGRNNAPLDSYDLDDSFEEMMTSIGQGRHGEGGTGPVGGGSGAGGGSGRLDVGLPVPQQLRVGRAGADDDGDEFYGSGRRHISGDPGSMGSARPITARGRQGGGPGPGPAHGPAHGPGPSASSSRAAPAAAPTLAGPGSGRMVVGGGVSPGPATSAASAPWSVPEDLNLDDLEEELEL